MEQQLNPDIHRLPPQEAADSIDALFDDMNAWLARARVLREQNKGTNQGRHLSVAVTEGENVANRVRNAIEERETGLEQPPGPIYGSQPSPFIPYPPRY